MQDTNQPQDPITAAQLVEKLVTLYSEILLLDEDAKEILKEAKEAGFDAPMLSKIAKAKAADKLGDLQDKTETLLGLIETLS